MVLEVSKKITDDVQNYAHTVRHLSVIREIFRLFLPLRVTAAGGSQLCNLRLERHGRRSSFYPN